MGRNSTITPIEADQILSLYQTTPNITTIVEETKIPYHKVYAFLKTMEKSSLRPVVSYNEKLVTRVVEQDFNAYTNLVSKMTEIESFIQQMKNEDGSVRENKSKDYLLAWKGLTDSLQWWIDRKLKVQELQENAIFRASIIETINSEFPSVARRVKELIEKKRKEMGLII